MKSKLLFAFLLFTTLTFAQQWVTIGGAQFTNNASDAAITFNTTGTPYVAYSDVTSGNVTRVKMFDGTNWVDVGGAVSSDVANRHAIAINPNDGQPWVVYRRTNNILRLYAYNGTTWEEKPNTSNFTSDNSEPLTLIYSNGGFYIRTQDHSQFNATWRDVVYNINAGNWGSTSISGLGRSTSNNRITADRNLNYVRSTANIGFNEYGDYQGRITATNTFFNKTVGGISRRAPISGNYWIAHIAAPSLDFEFYNMQTSKARPLGAVNSQAFLVNLDHDDSTNDYFLGYGNSGNEYAVEQYNTTANTWSALPATGISTTATGFFAKTIVNQFDDSVYIMYKDNNKVSVIKYEKPPALNRYYVDANVSGGDGSGDSWANAMTDLQQALTLADTTTTEIWVAQGTYKAGSSQNLSHIIDIANLSIYGGFAGTETNVTDRDIALLHTTNETIFSGDILGDDDANITFNNTTRDDNSLRIFRINASGVTLDGITITDAYADAASGEGRYGAGLKVEEIVNTFTIKNSIIKNNVAAWGSGMAIYTDIASSTIKIDACIFENNLGATSSTFYVLPRANRILNITISNSLFKDNATADYGTVLGAGSSTGWLRAYFTGSTINATVVNNTFVNNVNEGTRSSDFGTFGVARLDGNFGNLTFSNNIFWGNTTNGGSTAPAIGRVNTSEFFPPTYTVSHSIDEDGFSNLNGSYLSNIINTNPLFTNAANGDFTLQVGSPAVDAGDNSKVPSGITADLLGNQRIFNTAVDMGSYEFGAPSLGLKPNNTLQAFKVFPNPTKEHLFITTNEIINEIEVFNYLGQEVLKTTQTKINTNNLPDGIYLVKVFTTTGKIGIKRFIKN